MLTLDDYERIKKNSHVRTKEEEKNDKRILHDQKENLAAAAKAKKQKIIDIEKSKNNHSKPSDIDIENMIKNKEICERVSEIFMKGSRENGYGERLCEEYE